MPDAWELAPDTARTADDVTTFIIFCEDEVFEPSYFRSFQKAGKVKVNVIENQHSSFRNLTNTISYCEENGLLERRGGGLVIKDQVTQHIWSVYDRDTDPTNLGKVQSDNVTFTLAIQSAQQAGIKVAWSNDVFELWILLHFEEVAPGVSLPRSDVYQRLTNYFIALPDKPAPLGALTANEHFNYKTSLKKRTEFNLYVLPLLEDQRATATKRALTLENAFTTHQLHHECNPCTKVHHLVQSIVSFH